jgi:hypothetical protein
MPIIFFKEIYGYYYILTKGGKMNVTTFVFKLTIECTNIITSYNILVSRKKKSISFGILLLFIDIGNVNIYSDISLWIILLTHI